MSTVELEIMTDEINDHDPVKSPPGKLSRMLPLDEAMSPSSRDIRRDFTAASWRDRSASAG